MNRNMKKLLGLMGLMVLLIFGGAMCVQAAPAAPTNLQYAPRYNYPTTYYTLAWNKPADSTSSTYYEYQILQNGAVKNSRTDWYLNYATVGGFSYTKIYSFRVRAYTRNTTTNSYEVSA